MFQGKTVIGPTWVVMLQERIYDMMTRRDFLASATAATVATYAGEPHGLAVALEGSSALESTLAPARSGRWSNVARNRAVYQSSSADDDHTGHLVTDGSRQTFWKSEMGGEQWISVDLGRSVLLDRLTFHWGEGYARNYRVEVSEDDKRPEHWTVVDSKAEGGGGVEEVALKSVRARHVRLVGDAAKEAFSIYELEAWSVEAGSEADAKTTLTKQVGTRNGTLLTHGWQLQSAMFTKSGPEEIASAAYSSGDWIPAVVPATVLASYLAAGAVPDPYFGNQVAQLSDGFFTRNDFWYRNRFSISPDCKGRRLWLVFEGINWKAEICFNGKKAGQIDGAFLRGRFDVTEMANCGGMNCIAVLIRQVAHPGEVEHKKLGGHYRNGGVLGLDSPTFVSSIGWNWVPTIPGRNTGIWNNVRFETSGDVVLLDPWVTSELPSADHATAELTPRTEARNLSSRVARCVLHLSMNAQSYRHEFELQPEETRSLSLDSKDWTSLTVEKPRLWWPNGYGEPALHTMQFRVESAGAISDEKTVTFGIRKMEYETDGGILRILVNGQKILCCGGNWGMDDGMLICDAKGYDLRVRMHRDANLNMIRNWVGMVGRSEFYDACDRYGVLIWDDFWLANPGDGPDPEDDLMFMRNAEDKVRRVRSHASLAIYCGRNEGMPPKHLDEGLLHATSQLDGTRFYIPASDRGLVTGHGPYENQDPEWYFANRGVTFHSEQGIVCVPPVESMRAMMPEKDLWPISDMWAVHDYQEPRSPLYTVRIEQRYGRPEGVEDYCRKAQMVNLESAKAMFECLRSRQGGGQLIWMTQAAWPALICQLYDYYFEQTAAFFGAKAACEPLHILWDQASKVVKVANNTTTAHSALKAEGWIYDLDGHERWHQGKDLSVPVSSAKDCFPLSMSASMDRVCFVRLLLRQEDKILSENFYWSPTKQGDCKDLDSLKEASLSIRTRSEVAGNERVITVNVSNPGFIPAIAIRLMLVDGEARERVLPAFYEDNYFSLLPHAEKTVRIHVPSKVVGREGPKISLTGWNVRPEYH
jgi:hypothetical protein